MKKNTLQSTILTSAFILLGSLISLMAYGDSNLTAGCEQVTCPAENGESALHLPNPRDCGSFCKCDWGVAHWFDCPPNLHFNPELQVCDWPWNAGCDTDLIK